LSIRKVTLIDKMQGGGKQADTDKFELAEPVMPV